ncbi:MAG: T9SS type A sorting domain-containing protein [Bacteroidetes bacterium]|nr:T9SS type A sorting domain-containing protein [Bacteroidota bacterium]
MIVNPIKNTNYPQSICSNQSYLWNGIVQTTSGNYKDTFTSFLGCDSIVTLQLSLNPIKSFSFSQTICSNQSYTWNGISRTTSGNYLDTFKSSKNCDSIVTLNLIVLPGNNKSSSFSKSICSNQNYFWNGKFEYLSGNYLDTFPASNGCDSVVTLQLIVKPVKANSFNDTFCANETYKWNGSDLKNGGTFTKTLAASNGCDSTITLNLFKRALPSVLTNVSGNNIIALQNNAGYQWYNCATNQPILGATNQFYEVKSSGSYKVAVTSSKCTDFSICITIVDSNNINRIHDHSASDLHMIYPNPSNDFLNFIPQSNIVITQLVVTDAIGKKMNIPIEKMNATHFILATTQLESGVYYLTIHRLDNIKEHIQFYVSH